MTDDFDKQARIEREKTIRAGLWVIALLIVAAVLFGIHRFVTAPVRVAQDTTETITQAVEERATAVLTRRHIEVRQGRRFSRLADRAHAVLTALPATEPADWRERAFRAANLRGSQGRVCRFTMDVGTETVPVWTAADNADFETNRTLGGEAERQLRIVWQTPGLVIGVSVDYAAQYTRDDDAPHWELLWRRRDSLDKPLTDATIANRTLEALTAIGEQCGPSNP
ncbi:hypothetical protein [uncultured Algimonas sp.]|uniref:hypothetical protein n=1 Tax=uncultured Algimonas sp. TaxID=1547920 RepID=UPI0026095B3F|nr:hypothetical protein [uncultured Algimonas sp.]